MSDEPYDLGPGVKLTVMLTDDNWRYAQAAAAHEGDTVTNTINRALTLYYVAMTARRWKVLHILDRYDGKIMRWWRIS